MMGGQVGMADHVTIGVRRHAWRAERRHVRCSRRRALARLSGAAGARIHERRRDAARAGARTGGKSEGDE